MTYKHVWHETVIHMWQTTANDTQAYVWHETVTICGKQQQIDIKVCCDMKQLSICGKQQQMTHKHFWHETVIHMWQITANDTRTCLTWNSYPYVANNSNWHTNMFDMKQLPYVANNSNWHTSRFDMKQLSICGKQQQMTHKHVWHETIIHMWQTTANDTLACFTWNSYPYVANNSKWNTNMFDMRQLSICGKTTANGTEAFLTWNSCPYVANNSKWHTSMFDMKQLSICGKQQQMTQKHFWHETVVHMW